MEVDVDISTHGHTLSKQNATHGNEDLVQFYQATTGDGTIVFRIFTKPTAVESTFTHHQSGLEVLVYNAQSDTQTEDSEVEIDDGYNQGKGLHNEIERQLNDSNNHRETRRGSDSNNNREERRVSDSNNKKETNE